MSGRNQPASSPRWRLLPWRVKAGQSTQLLGFAWEIRSILYALLPISSVVELSCREKKGEKEERLRRTECG